MSNLAAVFLLAIVFLIFFIIRAIAIKHLKNRVKADYAPIELDGNRWLFYRDHLDENLAKFLAEHPESAVGKIKTFYDSATGAIHCYEVTFKQKPPG